MRDIKFRLFDKKSKTMVDVETIEYKHGMTAIGSAYDHPDNDYYGTVQVGGYLGKNTSLDGKTQVNRFSLMQYTGLKDKNGTEIYEKDVLLSGDHIDYVTFEQGSFFAAKSGYAVDDLNEVEVIGNIYENPELLEGEAHATHNEISHDI